MRLHPVLSAATTTALLAGTLALAGPAAAETVTLEPSGADARHFTASGGGWTAGAPTYGTGCVPLATCTQASTTPGFVSPGGVDGPGDGFLRTTVGSALALRSDATVAWTSPSFTAPAKTDAATLRAAIRADVGGLGPATVKLYLQLVDVAAPATPLTVVDDASVPASAAWGHVVEGDVPASAVVPGHTYALRLVVQVTAPLAAAPSGRIDIDDVVLRLVDSTPPPAPGPGDPGLGAPDDAPGAPGPGDAPGAPARGGEQVPGTTPPDTPRTATATMTDPGRFGAMLRACYGNDLALTQVTRAGRRVLVEGVSRYAAGIPVVIRDQRGAVVARTATGRDGFFTARAAAPPASRRGRTTYRALVGRHASRALRLLRATTLDTMRVRGRNVTMTGRVDVGRLGRRPRFEVRGGRGAAGCRKGATRLKLTGTVRLDRRTGAYRLTARVPRGSGHLVLRARALGRMSSYSGFVVR